MKRTIIVVGLLCLSATGCQTPNQTNGAIAGGVTGGLIGLGVGALTRNPAAGLAIGAGTGALVGNAVGANKDAQQAKAAAAYQAQNPPLSITDVVQLSAQRVPDNQIIQQIVNSNSWYNVTASDLQYLNQSGVSPAVVSFMQQRTGPRPVVYGPPPVVYGPPPVVYGPPPVGVGVIIR